MINYKSVQTLFQNIEEMLCSIILRDFIYHFHLLSLVYQLKSPFVDDAIDNYASRYHAFAVLSKKRIVRKTLNLGGDIKI